MKLSVCVGSVTGSLDKFEAMRYVKSLGYSAVEFWEGNDIDPTPYKNVLVETGLNVACMGFATGLVDPSLRQNFLTAVKSSLANAIAVGSRGIIVTTGDTLPHIPRDQQRRSIVEGLAEAASIVEGTGVCLFLEPLNVLVDHAGYFLSRSDEAFDILREVRSPNVKLLFDIYHQQITEGNLITNIVRDIDMIGHFHVAGCPIRGEPYIGEINYADVFRAADEAGYTGYAGLEFWPKGGMEQSLIKCLELYDESI